MHKEILTKEQVELLPLIKKFSRDFILVGGTAIALHLGHRQSIDFDLFTTKDFNSKKIKNIILKSRKIDRTFIRENDEFTLMVNKVKITFYNFEHHIPALLTLDKTIKLPDLLTLAAMKAFALGYRGKWKDYVDLYFIIKDHYPVEMISAKAKELFKGEFNQRIFREQLSYFNDINYREQVEFLPGFSVSDKKIKKELVKFSLEN